MEDIQNRAGQEIHIVSGRTRSFGSDSRARQQASKMGIVVVAMRCISAKLLRKRVNRNAPDSITSTPYSKRRIGHKNRPYDRHVDLFGICKCGIHLGAIVDHKWCDPTQSKTKLVRIQRRASTPFCRGVSQDPEMFIRVKAEPREIYTEMHVSLRSFRRDQIKLIMPGRS